MNKESTHSPKVLLIIRDGWGYSAETEHNIIAQAHTPYTDYLEQTFPTTLLYTSGEQVGLPVGFFGNSEVGHMTIGAGRVLEQSLLRINHAIADGTFFQNSVFLTAIKKVRDNNTKLHIIGLLQKEGVHASFTHLIALLELAKFEGLEKDDVCIHIITDGRDAPKQNALKYITELEFEIDKIGIGNIVSLAGRYYAMDRNQNWERTEKYYSAIMNRHCEARSNLIDYVQEKYLTHDFSDEFLKPIIHDTFSGISGGDSIIFYNFRKDRARQLTHAFTKSNFSEFETIHTNIHFAAMTEYFSGLPYVAFPDINIKNTLGDILGQHSKTQLRISETEKYAHVTYFFDGGVDKDFDGEKKILIPSPDAATFDLQPEMSSNEITQKLISEIEYARQDFILCNFPNADMVGHSGNHNALKKGIEAVDKSLEKIIPIALKNNYVIILTADHGNAEYKTGKYETSHTDNMVPCTIVSENYKNQELKSNLGLKNVLATVLEILNIPKSDIHESSIFNV